MEPLPELAKVRQWRLTKEANPVSIDEEIPATGEDRPSHNGIEDVSWLCERLANASSRRREQLHYWISHPYKSAFDQKGKLRRVPASTKRLDISRVADAQA